MTERSSQRVTARVESALRRMGLNEKEARVYMTMLELGSQPVRAIAAASGINRGTTYEILKSLIAQGLVSYFQKTRHQHFVAEDPSKLEALLTLRNRELEQTRRIVSEIVPLLQSRIPATDAPTRVRFFEGSSGIRTILEDVLRTVEADPKKEYHVYSSADIRDHLYIGFRDFSEKRVKLGIRVKTISLGKGGKLFGLDNRKWIPSVNHAPTYQIIYPGKLAMISLTDQGNPVGALLEDASASTTQKIIFDQLWSLLPD